MDKQNEITKAINVFKENQTLTNLGIVRNLGIGLKVLKSSEWQKLSVYNLPLRFICLYNDSFEISDLGVY